MTYASWNVGSNMRARYTADIKGRCCSGEPGPEGAERSLCTRNIEGAAVGSCSQGLYCLISLTVYVTLVLE